MKKAVRNGMVLLLIFTIPSCYSAHSISSTDYAKKTKEEKICEFETKENTVIKGGNKISIQNLESGISVTDSVGTKIYKYESLKSVSIKEFNTFHTILLSVGISIGIVIAYYIYLFSHLKLT